MKPKLVALNLVLVAAVSIVGWQAKTRWNDAQQRRGASLGVKVAPVSAPALPPTSQPEALAAAKYVDVAQKNLFAKDRNPNVIIDPPAPAEKPKPMPALPVLYGVMGLPSGVRALMADKVGGPTRSVQAGDRLGEFKVLSLDAQNIVFEWEGKEVPRKVDELIDRSSHEAPGAQLAGVAPVNAYAPPAPLLPPGQQPPPSAPQQAVIPPGAGRPGVEIGAPGISQRACAPGDGSPAGTVVDGYKKTVTLSPFGAQCRWLPVQ